MSLVLDVRGLHRGLGGAIELLPPLPHLLYRHRHGCSATWGASSAGTCPREFREPGFGIYLHNLCGSFAENCGDLLGHLFTPFVGGGSLYRLGLRSFSYMPFGTNIWSNTRANIEWGHGILKSTLAQTLVCNILRCLGSGNPNTNTYENILPYSFVFSMPGHMFNQFARQNCVHTFPYRCPSVLFRTFPKCPSVLFRTVLPCLFGTPSWMCAYIKTSLHSLADLESF